MKHHYNSDELAHVWVHNREIDYGNCPGSMSFRGNKFYSYSTVIASRGEYKGKEYYVLDRAGFSVTTSGHQSSVRCAISDTAKTFIVYMGERCQRLDLTPQALRDHYLAEAKEVRPRNGAKHLAPVRQAEAIIRKSKFIAQALEVCAYFGLPSKRIQAQADKLAGEVDKANEVITARETKREEANAKREALRRAKQEASANEYAQGVIDGKFTLRDGDFYRFGKLGAGAEFVTDETLRAEILAKLNAINANKIKSWRDGGSYDGDVISLPVMLRANPRNANEVQTSRGAIFPMSDARNAYRFAKLRKATGWETNGETCKVGVYRLDRINAEGVIAGCHRIAWAEIERFAIIQGWAGEAPATAPEAPQTVPVGWDRIEGGEEA